MIQKDRLRKLFFHKQHKSEIYEFGNKVIIDWAKLETKEKNHFQNED